MIKNFTCICCPRGCSLSIDTDTLIVSGNSCPKGKEYAINEITDPKRTLTSSVKVISGKLKRCSVRSAKPIPKNKMFDIMNEINKVEIKAPIKMSQVVISNVLDTNVDIISTSEVDVE